jgi:hypothetical protein
MQSKQYVVKSFQKIGDRLIKTQPIIDSRATGMAFVDKNCICHHHFDEKQLPKSR